MCFVAIFPRAVNEFAVTSELRAQLQQSAHAHRATFAAQPAAATGHGKGKHGGKGGKSPQHKHHHQRQPSAGPLSQPILFEPETTDGKAAAFNERLTRPMRLAFMLSMAQAYSQHFSANNSDDGSAASASLSAAASAATSSSAVAATPASPHGDKGRRKHKS